tara:strand:+ start:219 stop:1457 length:1239 start_codon:yes stop_codon:yes gene_type:complete
MEKNLITFDMSFTYKIIKERNLYAALESRSLDDYFTKVISVHPLSGLFEVSSERYGMPNIINIAPNHIFIEGKVGLTRWLAWIPPLNFIIAQFFLINKLINISKKEKVSVIKIGDPYYLGIIGLIMKFFLKVPLVIRVCARYDDIHKKTGNAIMPNLFRFRWIEKKIERIVFKRCDLTAGANEDNMKYGIENGAPEEKCTLFRYGNLLDPLHWIDPTKRNNADAQIDDLGLKNKKFLTTISRLETSKYIEHVIFTVQELRNRQIDVYALIIGDGSHRKEFENLAISKGISDYIKFAGSCKQEFIANILPRSSVILSPHMGRGLTEAALSGVPIVGYDYDWQREVIINNKTGYLIEHENWMAMSDAVEYLLSNQNIADKLGKNARDHIAQMMNPEKLNTHEKNSYSSIIESEL